MRTRILLNGAELHSISAIRVRPPGGWRPCRWQRVLIGTALLAATALLHAADTPESPDSRWRDIESRIQYGYYTEDARALGSLTELVAAAGERPDKLRSYYAALLDWRLSLLAGRKVAGVAGGSAAQLAGRCVSEAGGALALQADFAEALALRAACLAAPAAASGDYAPLSAYRAHRDLDKAAQLAARNPRVLLIDAMCDYQLPGSHGGDKERALLKLHRAVAAFEAERSDTEHLPGWGAAEAWLLLARDLLDHNDPLAARDALEHALLIAPGYLEARRLMSKITSG